MNERRLVKFLLRIAFACEIVDFVISLYDSFTIGFEPTHDDSRSLCYSRSNESILMRGPTVARVTLSFSSWTV